MGQKVSPIGFRIGITENWRSRWYANKKEFAQYLWEDQKIRNFIKRQYALTDKKGMKKEGPTEISLIEIERNREKLNIIIHTHKPGAFIGTKGNTLSKMKDGIYQFLKDRKREISIEIKNIATPEIVSQLVGENIADQLVKRANFRRCMKKAIEEAIKRGVLGIKIQISGRLAGAEMARTEGAVEGKVPLQTLNAHIDYGFAEAHTTYGLIGIKVWIYLGEYGKEISKWHKK
jgi:small subunit ribosomal protein S3